MKKKIVIKVQIHCNKCRSKAMKIIALTQGVESVSIEGDYKDQFVVIGEGVDSVKIAKELRKKVGHADIISVSEVKKEEKKEEKNEEKDKETKKEKKEGKKEEQKEENKKSKDVKPKIECYGQPPRHPNCYLTPQIVVCDGTYSSDPSCSIM